MPPPNKRLGHYHFISLPFSKLRHNDNSGKSANHVPTSCRYSAHHRASQRSCTLQLRAVTWLTPGHTALCAFIESTLVTRENVPWGRFQNVPSSSNFSKATGPSHHFMWFSGETLTLTQLSLYQVQRWTTTWMNVLHITSGAWRAGRRHHLPYCGRDFSRVCLY